MENEIIRFFISQGAFAFLFVCLLYYVLKTTKEREDNLNNIIEKNQEVITNLTESTKKINKIEKDVAEIKNKIK